MTRKREYIWYLEPRGDVAHTNKVLAANIGEENAAQICPSGLVFMLWNSRKTLHIQFGIFCQEGNGKPRRVTRWYGKNDRERNRRNGIVSGKF